MEGWVTLHRKFLQWEWFDKAEMVQLFIWLLLNASHTDRKWQGQVVKRGQILTTTPKIMEALNLSAQQTRTCIGRLKSTGEITCKSTNKYTIITICNYDRYQCENSESNRQNNGQTNTPATDKQRTNNGHNNNNNVIIKQLNNNNISVCSNSAHTREDKERDIIFKIFFLKNFEKPAYEVERFYNHYEAQGWERGNGQKIKNRIAAAKAWEQEDKTRKRFPEPFINAIREICEKLSDDDATKVMRAIIRIEIDATMVRLLLNAPVFELIEAADPNIIPRYIGRNVRYAVKRTN
jgi:hypothetical protein